MGLQFPRTLTRCPPHLVLEAEAATEAAHEVRDADVAGRAGRLEEQPHVDLAPQGAPPAELHRRVRLRSRGGGG